jgi:hypothetical protein
MVAGGLIEWRIPSGEKSPAGPASFAIFNVAAVRSSEKSETESAEAQGEMAAAGRDAATTIALAIEETGLTVVGATSREDALRSNFQICRSSPAGEALPEWPVRQTAEAKAAGEAV